MAWFGRIAAIAVLASMAHSSWHSVCEDYHFPEDQIVTIHQDSNIVSAQQLETDCDHCPFCTGSLALQNSVAFAVLQIDLDDVVVANSMASLGILPSTFRPPRA